MKLHLPVYLHKSVLSCFSAVAVCSLSMGVALAESQNLIFDGSSLIWNTSPGNQVFTNEDDAAVPFIPGDNVHFKNDACVTLDEHITAGQICIGADVTIEQGSYALNFNAISLQSGASLDVERPLMIAAGCSMNLAGSNSVIGNVQMKEGSILSFDGSGTLGMTTITGTLNFEGPPIISLGDSASGIGYNQCLLYVDGSVSGWVPETLTVISSVYGAEDLYLYNNDLLLLNYNEDTINPYSFGFKGDIAYKSRQVGDVTRRYYSGISYQDVTSGSDGGAIYMAEDGTISLQDNGDVNISGNSVSKGGYSMAAGGSIYGDDGSTIILSDNGSVYISRNSVISYHTAFGGAIYGEIDSSIKLSNNDSVIFSDNQAAGAFTPDEGACSAEGGAIWVWTGSLMLSNNGSVEFSANTASATSYRARGGAIYGERDITITLSNNGSVKFIKNTASAYGSSVYGGAIYARGNLSIQNNGAVEFCQNAEVSNGSYRLRSIYAGGIGNVISLSAAEGKSIKFRDSIYIASESTFNLNESYGEVDQKGDIIFTGATTEADLLAVKGSAGTAEEILASRTTEVNTMTNLYGGKLRVEDGAIYQGQGITAMAGSGATVLVKDATLSHSGYNLTFNRGTTLEIVGDSAISGNLNLLAGSTMRMVQTRFDCGNNALEFDYGTTLKLVGNNIIKGNVQMMDGSTLSFDVSEGMRCSNVIGSVLFGRECILSLDSDNPSYGNNIVLLYTTGGVYGWDSLALPMGGTLTGVDGMLILNYNAESFNKFFNGILTPPERQTGSGWLHHYESLLYANISTYTIKGGAIYAENSSTVTMCDNGTVVFSGNKASDGGAIYAENTGVITIGDNVSVTFTGNTASSSGGAIYGCSNSTISLSENGSVLFVENSTDDSVGGAIYGMQNSTIILSNNESVAFERNSASYLGGAIYGDSGSSIELSNNGSVIFSDNQAKEAFDPEGYTSFGGAIYGRQIILSNNESVAFERNSASDQGGAIYGDSGSSIELSNNGSVIFSDNQAKEAFTPDGYSTFGGAICTYGNLSIQNNDSVLFEKNAEIINGSYRLRSIYAGGIISFSAAEGRNITFRDSVYIASGSTFNLNETYGDREQKGDIIFTGATTVNDLYKVKGNVDGTMAEIQASRTSEVNTMTNLYGGRLRVEDGAIYKGRGITAHVGSDSAVLVKDAELSHVGYALEFNAGTALEVAGTSTIRGNVSMLEDSLFKLEKAALLSLHETLEADAVELTVNGTAMLEGDSTLNASLTLADGATLDMDVLDAGAVTLNGTLTFAGKVYMGTHLQDILSEMRGWEGSVTLFTGLTNLVLPSTVSEDATGRVWVGDVFSNMVGNQTHYLTYEAMVGSLSVVYVPETTTTTLSLLALAGLTMRRRRK